MRILVFTENHTVRALFKGFERSRTFKFSYFSCSEMKRRIKELDSDDFFYIDISGQKEQQIKKVLSTLSRLGAHRYGIIDPKGIIKDIPLLFFKGAADYIGYEVYTSGVTTARLKSALSYSPPCSDRSPTVPKSEKKGYILSGKDWKNIKAGHEYTFCMMFIELDNHVELKKKIGEDLLDSMLASFRRYIENTAASIQGRLWIWNDHNGLVLYPFDGVRCDAVLLGFRLMLFRKLICADNLPFDTLFSYRIALQLGNTVYRKKGQTGTLVSDSINSIFHIGRNFTPPGHFYLTKELIGFVPEGLKPYFLPAGRYKEIEIMRMKRPL
jgi:hypothetical protein